MDHSDNALRAAIKALSEVVAPAVDPTDSQAVQQLRLVIDSLDFLRQRLEYLHDRERFDVRHHLAVASAVVEDADADALRDAIASAEGVYGRPEARTAELRAASAALAAELRNLVRDVADADPSVRSRVERRILGGTRERIEADRAWHAPQGFDPDPGSTQPLEAALGLRP
jgi:hypothetical protein